MVVTTELAVVVAEQPDQEVQGGFVPHEPLVQPDHVDGGQADEPHQLVHGPFVHDPDDPHGPYPFPGPPGPNGPYPPPALQPGAPVALGAPVTVAQYEEYDAQAELVVGYAEPPEVAENDASGAAVMAWPVLAQICARTW